MLINLTVMKFIPIATPLFGRIDRFGVVFFNIHVLTGDRRFCDFQFAFSILDPLRKRVTELEQILYFYDRPLLIRDAKTVLQSCIYCLCSYSP